MRAAVPAGWPCVTLRTLRAAFRWGFVPALLLASMASWFFHAAIDRLLIARGSHLDAITAIFLLTLLTIWVAEQIFPARADWNYRLTSVEHASDWGRLGRDLLYLFVVTQLTALLIKFTAAHVTPTLNAIGIGHALWPTTAPLPLKVLLAFLLIEFLSYWTHRASHAAPFIWRFHSTHHVITEMNGLKSMRVHPVDNAFFYLARSVPLMLLGAGTEELLTVTYFGSILGVLSHANISVREGWLGWFVNFPRFHEVHHSVVVAEANANFGCHTVIWDRVFGTFRQGALEPLVVGVLPSEPRSIWRELVGPFYRRKP